MSRSRLHLDYPARSGLDALRHWIGVRYHLLFSSPPDNDAALRQILRARDFARLEAVERRRGIMRYLDQSGSTGLDALILPIARLDLLEDMSRGGLLPARLAGPAFAVTLVRDDPDHFAFCTSRFGSVFRVLPLGTVLASCTPRLAGPLAGELDILRQDQAVVFSDLVSHLARSDPRRITHRGFALLLVSGLPLAEDIPILRHGSPALRALARQTRSAHGRLHLRRTGPGLEEILSASPDDALFGFTQRSFAEQFRRPAGPRPGY